MIDQPVLYVLKRFPRLSETFVLRELLELEAMGTRVAVDALLEPEPGPHQVEVTQLRAHVRYLPNRPRLRMRSVARAHFRIAVRAPIRWARCAWRSRREGTWRRFVQAGLVAERVRRENAARIHAHFATAAAEVARDASYLSRVPFSVTAHAKDIFHVEHARRLRRRVEGAAAVITVSEYNSRHLETVLEGIPVHHVPNGVRLPEPVQRTPANAVLCVARLVPKKGIDVLIDATALLGADLPDLRVEIIGGGELLEDLAARARTCGVAERVDFLGPRPYDNVQAAFMRNSMMVLPCRITTDGDRDGIPTALVEAMAHGLPVISTAVAGITEIVRHGETGLVVAPDDPHALAAAIAKLAHDPQLAADLGAAGRELVAQRFAPDRSALALRRIWGIHS